MCHCRVSALVSSLMSFPSCASRVLYMIYITHTYVSIHTYIHECIYNVVFVVCVCVCVWVSVCVCVRACVWMCVYTYIHIWPAQQSWWPYRACNAVSARGGDTSSDTWLQTPRPKASPPAHAPEWESVCTFLCILIVVLFNFFLIVRVRSLRVSWLYVPVCSYCGTFFNCSWR